MFTSFFGTARTSLLCAFNLTKQTQAGTLSGNALDLQGHTWEILLRKVSKHLYFFPLLVMIVFQEPKIDAGLLNCMELFALLSNHAEITKKQIDGTVV